MPENLFKPGMCDTNFPVLKEMVRLSSSSDFRESRDLLTEHLFVKGCTAIKELTYSLSCDPKDIVSVTDQLKIALTALKPELQETVKIAVLPTRLIYVENTTILGLVVFQHSGKSKSDFRIELFGYHKLVDMLSDNLNNCHIAIEGEKDNAES